ncbi:MAG: hypothetical protein KGJ13_04665 [Patescibacteria group bacterium]|nr:hypothetical protein [Patescibacteria group bacterium]
MSPAPFKDANELRKAIFKCVNRAATLDLKSEGAVQALLSDDEVESRVFKCAEKAIYDGIKVNQALFDDPRSGEKARADYFEIFSKIMEENINPFFQTASLESSAKPEKSGVRA